MTVDNQSRIYIAYKSDISLIVQRILADGTSIDGAFNVTASIDSCNPYQIKLVLDQAHNQLIVANYYQD